MEIGRGGCAGARGDAEDQLQDVASDSYAADRLLGREVSDVDGNTEQRTGTVSMFNGPAPVIEVARSARVEASVVGKWLSQRVREGIAPHEIAVFVRSEELFERAQRRWRLAGYRRE